jgi:uncharacterized protein (TIGR00297 family)
MPLLHDATLLTVLLRAAAGAVMASAIALGAYRARALTLSGAVAAIVVGALSFAFGGLLVAAAIIIFFASGSVLGRLGNATADRARRLAAKDAQRDAAQVGANGAVAVLCAIAAGVAALLGWPHSARLSVAAVCAIAAASGDTWSTEIGAFARGATRRITDLRPVHAGTSGGITLLGTVAAPLGGAVVGGAGIFSSGLLPLSVWVGICALAGLAGSLFDSVLGATLQALWRCPMCQTTAETRVHSGCSSPAELVRGLSWLDNDGVNAAMTLVGAALGYALGAIFY